MKRNIQSRKERIQSRIAQVFDYLKIQPDEFPIVLEFIEIYKAQLKSKQIKELDEKIKELENLKKQLSK